jgi:Asp/Glu/hydantoin racemase
MAGMRIIVVNVNTSESMTGVIGEAARRHASAGTEIIALRPYFGAEAVDCNFESYLSAVAVMDRVVGTAWPLSIALGLRPAAAGDGPAGGVAR